MNYLSKKDIPKLKRKPSAKKGDAGRVLVIGGSKEYAGAVALAAIAALRSGCDWITVYAPEKVGWVINTLSLDLVVKKAKGEYFSTSHVKEALELEKKHDVVLIGNGISLKSKAFVQEFVKRSKKPLVIDADAIKVLSLGMLKNTILTPHKKELELLMKNSKIKTKSELQKKINTNVTVLKGKTDEIITKNKTFYNKTGNPGLAKAGTGDVLAGLIAGFLAQTKDPLLAAKMGTYYNGIIGDLLLKKKKGFTYLASDMLDEIIRII